MREILFRGKRVDNGEWVCGYLIQDTEVYGKEDRHSYIVNHKHPSGCFGSDIYIEVIPETVGQYTGLTDKNGTKIFEGDIVTGLFLYSLPVNGLVSFQDGSFGLIWHFGDVEKFNPFTSMCNVIYEVIGNIHDNPELLEEA